MSLRSTILLTCCLLVAPHTGEGAEPAPVTTADIEAVQLQALEVTDAKLSALAHLPAQQGSPPLAQGGKAHRVKRRGGKGRAVHPAVTKAPGRSVTVSEVRAILAASRDLSGLDLSGLDLAGLDLSGVNLSRADLSRANLSRADLSEADLELADLTNANFTRATLHMARFHGTRVWGARFDGALWTDRSVCRSGSLGRCRDF